MLMLLACTGVHAYDFEKDGIYYNVTSLTDLTVEVTCEEEYASENSYRGDIVIPEQVERRSRSRALERVVFHTQNCQASNFRKLSPVLVLAHLSVALSKASRYRTT